MIVVFVHLCCGKQKAAPLSFRSKINQMKRILIILTILFFGNDLKAQTSNLNVQVDSKNQPYLIHTIGPKENFYSIGRMYNISPRVFAPYNGLELTSGLSIGQPIHIPLTEMNFWKTGVRKENEVVVPLYYIIQEKETLTSITKLFAADQASIRSWNNLSSDALSVGQQLIIGFLKVDKALSPLAAQGMPVRKEPTLVQKESGKEPVAVVKEQPKEQKTEQAPVQKEPVQAPVAKEEPKTEVPAPVVPKDEPAPVTYSGTGYFETEFRQQSRNGKNTVTGSGKGASFKSTSGWTDGKYYILMDQLEKGTIVLVKNPTNGKSIYAKVLAGVGETNPGSGLYFMLSSSAASQLGYGADQFNAELEWPK
jgi:LysM repeat protein